MDNGKKKYTITWFVENYSYCWHKNGEKLISPEFTADGLEGTVWTLQLYPRGSVDKYKGSIGLFLKRNENDFGPESFLLKYELSFLLVDGTAFLSGKYERAFKMGNGSVMNQFPPMDEVLVKRKADYLLQDTLSVRCRIWKGEGKLQPVTRISARTRISIEEVSFHHVLEGFSLLESDKKKTIHIGSPSEKGLILSSSLYVTDGSCCDGKIMVEILPASANQILWKCKLSLLDVSGKKTDCGQGDNRFDATRKDIRKLPLSLTKQEILTRKSEFLPNDKLSLFCECSFSTGVEYDKIESTVYEKPFVDTSPNSKNNQKKDLNNSTEKLFACPSALDDFKTIYNNQLFTDVELKTETKTFPAHKIVVCARSSVFKAMMTNDMKEKNSNVIQIDDLENDIVQQLLLFLYCDNLENLQWESATKLYYAADKYVIEKLKVVCSNFLVDNLTTSKAGELLLLADTHNDLQLKKDVESFILKQEEQVFGSEEWENLIETNPLLASKTMLLKYKRNS